METAVKSKKGGNKARHVRVPTKRSLNMATVGEKKLNPLVAIPTALLVIAIAVLLSKVAVIDRFVKVSQAEAEVAQLQREVDSCYRRINSYGAITELYAHYTYSDMTTEELDRANRVSAANMIWEDVMPEFRLTGWSVKGNQLELNITGSTLEEINGLSQRLLEEPIVDYCSVMTAATTTNKNEAGYQEIDGVNAKVTVYLNKALEEEGDNG